MEDFFQKRKNETDEDCIYRICALKNELNYTWSEMADVLNDILNKNYSESKYRKDYSSFTKFNKCVDFKKPEEPEDAEKDLKEFHKSCVEKIENNRIIRQKTRQELFYENIGKTLQKLPPLENDFVFHCNEEDEYEYVLTIADLQAGAKFDLDCNSYSLQECVNRFDKLLDDVSQYVVKNNINKLHIVELGDTIQGILRISDLKLNETSVVEATVVVSRLIAKFLNNLSQVCNIEYYHVPSSNHSQTRPLGTKASELMYEDIEFIIGNYIMDLLSNNDRINVHTNFGYDYIDVPIYDFNVIAMHGHTIKSLENALRDLSVMHRKLMDYVFIGHFHNGKVIPGNAHESHDTELLMSPSFQGADPFAYNKLGLTSKAACKMYQFDKKYGCVGTHKFILN